MKPEVRNFLAQNAGVPVEKLTDDLDLFEGEIWDSLLIVRFFAFVHEKFGIDIDLAMITEDKIRTIPAIISYLSAQNAGPKK